MANTKKRKKKKRRKSLRKSRYYFVSLALISLASIIAVFFIVKHYASQADSFASKEYVVKGVDISHHNPILNWNVLAEQNINFAYIKASEGGSHTDRNYKYNYELAKKTNVHVGAYHFYTFGLSGKEQAKHFIKTARFESGDMIPAIDVEHSQANPYSKDDKYIALVIDELKELENELYNHFGIHPIIYTNKDCYKLYIKDNFQNSPIWICDILSDPSDYVPNWKIWQFTHNGKIPGIDGNIDMNYYRYTFNEFKELLLP